MAAEDTMFSQFPRLKEKSYHSDWSVKKLTVVLFYHLGSSPYSYFFFLDGLDEIYPKDGPRNLLQLVDKLMDLPSVKLCVSSRPENVFEGHFKDRPSLRMQDLIASDIRNYAYKVFEERTEFSNLPYCVDRVINTFVYKADGVFLWVVLVLESLWPISVSILTEVGGSIRSIKSSHTGALFVISKWKSTLSTGLPTTSLPIPMTASRYGTDVA